MRENLKTKWWMWLLLGSEFLRSATAVGQPIETDNGNTTTPVPTELEELTERSGENALPSEIEENPSADGDKETTSASTAVLPADAETTATAAPTTAVVPPPEPVPEPVPVTAPQITPMPVAGYDNGFFLQSPDGAFKLTVQGRIKTRYTFISTDTGPLDSRRTSTSLSIPSARLHLAGYLFSKRLSYVLDPDFGDGNVRLMLAFGVYAFIPQKLQLTFGQFKRPFSREKLVMNIKKAFIDDPIGQFGHGVDIGLQLSNDYMNVKGLEWAIGVFNSSNPTKPVFIGTVVTDDDGNQTVEDGKFSNAIQNFNPAIVTRIGYNNGIKGYWPTDFEGGPVRFGIAASGHVDFDLDADDLGKVYINSDFALKAYGFSLSAAVYVAWADEGNIWDTPAYAGIGSFGQVGYFFGRHFEPVVRYDILNGKGADDLQQEITVGFTFYFYKQIFKLENNFGTFLAQAGDLVHFQYSSQIQLVF